MYRFLTRSRVGIHAAAAYAAAYLIWLAVRTPGTWSTVLISDAAFLPLGLVVAWACWRTGRTEGLDRRTRLAWFLLAGSALDLWLVGNLWSLYLLLKGPGSWPEWLDWLEPTQALFAIAAYLTFPGRPVESGSRRRFLLDISLTVVAGFALAYQFGVRGLPDENVRVWSYTVTTMAVDWLMFVAAAVGVVQKRDATTRAVLAMLLASHGASLLGNYWLSTQEHYVTGDSVDGLWFLGWVLKYAAVVMASRRYREGPRASDAGVDLAETAFRGSAFAHLMVAGAFVLVIVQFLIGDRQSAGMFAALALAMVALLFFRQLAALGENRHLLAAQLAQEARFRSLVQNSSDLVLVANAAGIVTYVSPSGIRLFGEHPAFLAGGRVTDLFPTSGVATLALAHPAEPRRLQTRVQTQGGEWRDVEVVATNLLADPAVAGVVFNCRDVTERTALEQTLLHAQKLDAVGRLAGGLAHDLNNVLAAIRGYAELLHDDMLPGTEAWEGLRNIQYAADRAAGVTKKLLSLSRSQSVQRTSLDLNDVLVGLRPILRQLLTDRVEVALDCSADLWPVKADRGQMEQVIINLATNARDAMPDGGCLHIRTGNHTIRTAEPGAGRLAPGEYGALVVTDQGTGMSTETRSRLFEPFFTTKPQERGMGLGLTMVHGIVEDSGGDIRVESTPGAGSVFTILLPRTSAEAAAPAKGIPEQEREVAGGSVLLVDDELAVRTVVREMLERRGYHVAEATDGEAALAAARDPGFAVDVLLTDMVMPGMAGRELIGHFAALRPGVPVVCISGFADDADSAGDLGEPVVALVTKPFSSDTLARAVGAAIAARVPVA